MVVESFRPGVVDRLGIGFDDLRAVNPGIILCSTTGYGQDGPRSAWAGHDINYLAVGGYLAATEPRADGGPPVPGATIADAAGGGMQAAMAVMAALIGRGADGPGAHLDVSIADGVLWLTSLAVDEHLATGAEVGHGHNIITGRYACYDTYQAADGGWLAVGAIEPKFYANLCRLLGCEQWTAHQLDDEVQDKIRADFRAAFATRDRDTWVAELAGGRHLRDPGAVGGRAGRRRPVPGPPRLRRRRGRAGRPAAGGADPVPPGRPGAGRDAGARRAGGDRRPAPVRHRPAAGRGRTGTVTHRRPAGTGDRGMSAIGIADIDGLIGVEQYEEEGEFPVEQGYVWTTCSSVENGNPLFWDEEVADAVTGGPDRPADHGLGVVPSPPLGARTRRPRDCPCRSTSTSRRASGLPEAVMSDNTIVFHEPVRPGDRLTTRQILRSVSDEKTTKLGTGRFWVIDVEYRNQRGELVAVESYTGFGYRRAGAPSPTAARS